MPCLTLLHLLISLAGSLAHGIISYSYLKSEWRHSEHCYSERQQASVQSPSHTTNRPFAQGAGPSWKFDVSLLKLQAGPLVVVGSLAPSILICDEPETDRAIPVGIIFKSMSFGLA